jgi:hypothetical protein
LLVSQDQIKRKSEYEQNRQPDDRSQEFTSITGSIMRDDGFAGSRGFCLGVDAKLLPEFFAQSM